MFASFWSYFIIARKKHNVLSFLLIVLVTKQLFAFKNKVHVVTICLRTKPGLKKNGRLAHQGKEHNTFSNTRPNPKTKVSRYPVLLH